MLLIARVRPSLPAPRHVGLAVRSDRNRFDATTALDCPDDVHLATGTRPRWPVRAAWGLPSLAAPQPLAWYLLLQAYAVRWRA